jgi:hypothetical protein
MPTFETVRPPPRDRAADGLISKRCGGGFDQQGTQTVRAGQVNVHCLFVNAAARVTPAVNRPDWHDQATTWSERLSPIRDRCHRYRSSVTHPEEAP